MSQRVWVSQLGAALEFRVLWRSSMTIFNLRSLMIFASRVFFTLGATREATVVSLGNWIEFLSIMIGLSSFRILKRFSFPIEFRIIFPPWLNLGCKAGDRNSSYFFKAINGKRNRSKIHTITGDDGSLTEGDILVKKEAIRHFQTILGCPRPVSHGIGSTLSNINDKVISNGQADFMGRDVTDDEIREVCFSLHPNKAPGRDGFNFHFFKITWDIVGEDVISAVQEFFRSGLLL
ncbi:hypothetical protein Dsin_018602 [Dipteronia sinensis]|uniref:Uncharacterized protein n=1 Tax=Dipteronia sinensis TaxID=43782 RepID=A0AAE0A744_9ROSI|nr:hypothetical protein Dsin_018602 [Dipteronia sinensis]